MSKKSRKTLQSHMESIAPLGGNSHKKKPNYFSKLAERGWKIRRARQRSIESKTKKEVAYRHVK